jgi:hypothetical protein
MENQTLNFFYHRTDSQDSVSTLWSKSSYDSFRIGCTLVAVLIAVLLLSVDVYGSLVVYRKVNARVSRPTWSRGVEPTKISLMHCLLFIGHKMNFKIQMIKGLIHVLRFNYMHTPMTTENDVVHYILNTSLSLFTHFGDTAEKGARQDGQIKATFIINDFAFPCNALEGKHDSKILVEFSIPSFNEGTAKLAADQASVINTLKGCSVQRFLFNEEPVLCVTEQITILSTVIASVVHPMEHSFNERVYSKKDEPALQ